MDERDGVIWLHRRAGFGLSPSELREALGRGAGAELRRLIDPSGAGAPATTDPWDDSLLPYDPQDQVSKVHSVAAWVEQMVLTEQPLVDRMALMWHGHFVSAIDKVRIARLMVDQVRLFRSSGLGPFRDLLRAVSIDPAMLVYLDLRTSTGSEPNENYARELMELFTLGEGQYSEADVKAGAVALTGWTLTLAAGLRFAPRLHDDTPQTYLGVDGVHDLDTVIDAVMAHPAMPVFVASTVAAELLGDVDEGVVQELAAAFTSSGFDVRALVKATLEQGLAGESSPILLAPVPWLVQAMRMTGAPFPQGDSQRRFGQLLDGAGQMPMKPPNVAGWPGGAAWLGASSMVARANLAALVAAAATDESVLSAARDSDPGRLAEALGLPSAGFSASTSAALAAVPSGRQRLAVALVAPEFLIA